MLLHLSRARHRFELFFWNLAITLMSRSTLVRTAMVRLHQAVQPLRTPAWQRRSLTLAGAGLASGVLIGALFAITF